MDNIKLSERHRQALDYAVAKIKSSILYPYVSRVYLFGSCARGDAGWESDVDLLLVLKEEFREHPELKKAMIHLKSEVITHDIADPETDLKIVIGDQWETDVSLFYDNIRKEGIELWI